MNKINAGLYCYMLKLNQSYQRGQAAIQSGYISVTDSDGEGNKEEKKTHVKKKGKYNRSLIN